MSKKLTQEDFLKKAEAVHGDKYDYSKAVYVNSKKKVKIVCKTHGVFMQTPHNHYVGKHGCPRCRPSRLGTDGLIEQYKRKFNGKYDYSKVEYEDTTKYVTLICETHGGFASNTKTLSGCETCFKDSLSARVLTTNEFIQKAKEVHGNRYDYSESRYEGNKVKVKIICPEHGLFLQEPSNHTQGKGCPKCGYVSMKQKQTSSTDKFVSNSVKIHKDAYRYDKVNYKGSFHKIDIECPIHGIFRQTPNSHLQGSGCPKCSHSVSKKETELAELINGSVRTQVRDVISPKELDIYLPEHKLAIEYNGTYWHTEQYGKDRNYHLDKSRACEEKGVQLIHVWEHKNFEAYKSMILHRIGKTPNKVYARKCLIKPVDSKTAREFFNRTHVDGCGRVFSTSDIVGLYLEDKLVSCMAVNITTGELLRFSNELYTSVVGGFSKLLKQFKLKYKYLYSFLSLDFGTKGNQYYKEGFTLSHISKPNYIYTDGRTIRSRISSQKHKIVTKETKDLTEKEIMESKGFYRLYDCGNYKFEWRKIT